MDLLPVLILAALTFGICFLADKGFTKAFRSDPRQAGGRAVRMNRHVGGIGIAVVVLGVLGIVAGVSGSWMLLAAGCVVLLTGITLVTIYLSFGVYYDDHGFLVHRFGKKPASHRYEEICAQQLFNTSGRIVVELRLLDGSAVQLQQGMTGRDEFLDKAFAGWLAQKGLKAEDCDFHDPSNSCWFPPVED